MNRKVAVTGIGLLTPLGLGAIQNSEALQAGKSGVVSRKAEWSEMGLRSQVAGNVDAVLHRQSIPRKEQRFMCDAAVLSYIAFQDAVRDAALSPADIEDPRTGLVMGTGAGSSLPDSIALGERLKLRGGSKVGAYQVPLIMGSSIPANLGSVFHIHGHTYAVTSACATSAHAAMIGLDLIRSGRQKRVFVGGAEDVNVFSASAFDGMNALSSAFNDRPEKASRPLDRGRDGFVFSGGAAVLVLEDYELARSRGARIRAILSGAAATCDGDDMVVPNGKGAEAAMRLAMEDAGVAAEQIDYLNLHGTSTPTGDLVEVQAVVSTFGSRVPSFSSTKSMTGHALGAAGAMEAAFCVIMMNDGFLAANINLEDPEPLVQDLPVVRTTRRTKPAVVLSNSFGFGGTNCSLIFSQP